MGRNKFCIRKKWLETFDKNNVTTPFNALYVKKGKLYPACVSKTSSNQEKQVIFLLIPNGEKWSALLRGITSENNAFLLFEWSSFL